MLIPLCLFSDAYTHSVCNIQVFSLASRMLRGAT